MATISIPQNPTERREWIKYQLRLRGSSFSALARELGVHRSAVSLAMMQSSSRIEVAIAEKLDLTPAQLWPERYLATPTA